jgi:hypothetical protein
MPLPTDTARPADLRRPALPLPDAGTTDGLRASLPTFPQPGRLLPGDLVEVQNHFDGGWSRGFEVVDVLTGMGSRRYRIKRISDGVVLPRLFVEDEVGDVR